MMAWQSLMWWRADRWVDGATTFSISKVPWIWQDFMDLEGFHGVGIREAPGSQATGAPGSSEHGQAGVNIDPAGPLQKTLQTVDLKFQECKH